jgi:hypothetical protein
VALLAGLADTLVVLKMLSPVNGPALLSGSVKEIEPDRAGLGVQWTYARTCSKSRATTGGPIPYDALGGYVHLNNKSMGVGHGTFL